LPFEGKKLYVRRLQKPKTPILPVTSSFPFPEVNATLNATSALMILAGLFFIRHRQVASHRACMLAASATSFLFLISYLTYHALAGVIHFAGRGLVRKAYFVLLTSHTILAVVILPMVLRTLYLGLTGRIEKHRRLARWTAPLWMYVSVTGVVVYWMLYRSPWKT